MLNSTPTSALTFSHLIWSDVKELLFILVIQTTNGIKAEPQLHQRMNWANTVRSLIVHSKIPNRALKRNPAYQHHQLQPETRFCSSWFWLRHLNHQLPPILIARDRWEGCEFSVVCWLHYLLYETQQLSWGATELQAAKTFRNPCAQRNNTPFDMRSGNTAKENKCFHCSEWDREFLPLCYICSWFDSQDEPRPLSLIDFRCQRQANNEGSVGIYLEVLQGCSWAFLLQVFFYFSLLDFFFSFLPLFI